MVRFASKTSTESLARARVTAAARPFGPEPTTTASNSPGFAPTGTCDLFIGSRKTIYRRLTILSQHPVAMHLALELNESCGAHLASSIDHL
jgi:hypothetical protein